MNESTATYVATCHPFVATENLPKRRELARQAKNRRDPDGFVVMRGLVADIRAAILEFAPTADTQLAAWFGTADRLAYVYPSGALELLGGENERRLAFITAVGPRSYWPSAEAAAYAKAVVAFKGDLGTVDALAHAAKDLVTAACHREAAWSPEEWEYRTMAAIAAWIYWDDEPGGVAPSN
jgi:hypothetical protein